MKFTEAQLEAAIIELLGAQGYPHRHGSEVALGLGEVLIKDDLRAYLQQRYGADGITAGEVELIVNKVERLPASDLYGSNKAFMKLVADGFLLKREERAKKDLFVNLIDYSSGDGNIYKLVNQLEIQGFERRIPDALLYINGLPLVVFEFKSAIREEASIYDAYVQLTRRYRRDIPELLKYNALCVISDGVNNKMGSLFADYEFYYSWRKVSGDERIEWDGIDSLYTMIRGLFDRARLRDVIHNFIFFPDSSKREEKIVCRYPQYYAARKLFANIQEHRRPDGDGKGGTYFGATGCGKSFIMLFLSRLLMKSAELASPTLVLITDRVELDEQLSQLFIEAKGYIGDAEIVSVESRARLRECLRGPTELPDKPDGAGAADAALMAAEEPAEYALTQHGRVSGGVFLTTIHKFTEDTRLLTRRDNVICISDEAHRSQVNLDQKLRITEQGVQRRYGFAKYLHDSLPNATYVGFTGTPIDATLDVFGKVVDAYTMEESVRDEITVRIVYEGRAAKVLLDNAKIQEIEDYYARCADEGASDYAIEESKRANVKMNSILGDPERIRALAEDFVQHYETRLAEGATVAGKAMFVCSNRMIAYRLYQEITALRPEWATVQACAEGATLSAKERRELKPMPRVNMVMTRAQDDDVALYKMLGSKEQRTELDRQFKNAKSNFKVAIVVDMWLTGFDVPLLDTIYIDKPIQRHSLIQTISRVNRRYADKDKGLVVDYIGIKKQMNLALAQYGNPGDGVTIEEVQQAVVVVKDHLELLGRMFHRFDASPYFSGDALQQLHCLNMAAEFVQVTERQERQFMFLVKRMKAAYDICCNSDAFAQLERDTIHFYIAVRSIVFKLTRGDAPDLAQMNARVREMIEEAIKADGVEEVFKLGDGGESEIDLFDDEFLEKIKKIKLPNTKLKLLQKLLKRAIDDFRKVNRAKGSDFAEMFKALVDKYNERKEQDVLVSNVLEDFTDEIIDLYDALKKERGSFAELGIDFEEKAFYDILLAIARKYDFEYPEDKLIVLARAVKGVVDDKTKYTDWDNREDIKAELKVDLIILLAENGYPPVTHDDVYKEIFEQAQNFKKYRG